MYGGPKLGICAGAGKNMQLRAAALEGVAAGALADLQARAEVTGTEKHQTM